MNKAGVGVRGSGDRVKMLHYTKHNLDELIRGVEQFDKKQGITDSVGYWRGQIQQWIDDPSRDSKLISHSCTSAPEIKLIGKLAELKGAICVYIDSGEYKNMHLFKSKADFQKFEKDNVK